MQNRPIKIVPEAEDRLCERSIRFGSTRTCIDTMCESVENARSRKAAGEGFLRLSYGYAIRLNMDAPYLSRSRWLAEHVLPNEPAIRAWLRRTTNVSDSDLDDIVQETYAILAKIDDVHAIRDPRSYAIQVAKSVFLQALRRNKVVAIGSIAELAALGNIDDAPDPEQQAHGQRELRRVEAAIGDMSPQVRKVFWLRRVEGLSQRETAQKLGLAEHTVEKYSARGLKFLLSRFGNGGISSVESSRDRDRTPIEFETPNARPRPSQ